MKRRQAREIAVQSLYRMEMNEISVREAVQNVLEQMISEREYEENKTIAHPEESELTFVYTLVEGVLEHQALIDTKILSALQGWEMDRLSRVDRQILRVAVFEMQYVEDDQTPPKVIINEAIDLAKSFGVEESGKFVNGVLGKMIQEQLL